MVRRKIVKSLCTSAETGENIPLNKHSKREKVQWKEETKQIAKELRPKFSSGNFCYHPTHICTFDENGLKNEEEMEIVLTPDYFPNGRFGPLILDLSFSPDNCYNHYFSHGNSDTEQQGKLVKRVVDVQNIDNSLLELLKHEISTLRRLCHPNIMPILSTTVQETTLSFTMPLADHGSCRVILEKHFNYGFKEKLIKHVVTSVLSAVYYLHFNAILHSRICSRNVLMSARGHVYLTGFEYALDLYQKGGVAHDLPEDIVDYLPWTAPEVLAQNIVGFSYPSDVYSVGVLSVELNNAIAPFTDPINALAPSLVMLEKMKGFTPRLLDSSTLSDSEIESTEMDMMIFKQRKLSREFHAFVECCCRTNPIMRPTVEQLLKTCSFTNPIEQRRNSCTADLISELPIAELPFTSSVPSGDENIDAAELAISNGNGASVVDTTQLTVFETIVEETDSQFGSQTNANFVQSTSEDKKVYWLF